MMDKLIGSQIADNLCQRQFGGKIQPQVLTTPAIYNLCLLITIPHHHTSSPYVITIPHHHTSSPHLITIPHHHTSSPYLITTPHHITIPHHHTSSPYLITIPHHHTSSPYLITTPHHHTSSPHLQTSSPYLQNPIGRKETSFSQYNNLALTHTVIEKLSVKCFETSTCLYRPATQ